MATGLSRQLTAGVQELTTASIKGAACGISVAFTCKSMLAGHCRFVNKEIVSTCRTQCLGRGKQASVAGWRHSWNVRPQRVWRIVASVEEAADVDKNELLKDAAKAGDLNKVRELIGSGGVDINIPSPARAGWTALQLGAFYGHSEVTSYLLWAGADTEGRNGSGNTALQLACLKGNVEIARLLLDAGADIDAVSNDKGTPIEYAQEWGGDEIVDFLLLWAAQNKTMGG